MYDGIIIVDNYSVPLSYSPGYNGSVNPFMYYSSTCFPEFVIASERRNDFSSSFRIYLSLVHTLRL